MRLVYFAPVRWSSYDQRPHAFARAFLAAGAEVCWVDPYPIRLPRWSDVGRSDLREPWSPTALPDRLTVVRPFALPIEPLPGGAWLNAVTSWRDLTPRLAAAASGPGSVLGIGRPSALATRVLEAASPSRSFYDAMDAFPEFYDGRTREAVDRLERQIVNRAHVVLASSPPLVDRLRPLRPDVSLAPNGFDMHVLDPVGPDEARVPPAEPLLGYIGTVGRWFDWRLVARLAEAVAPMPIVIVGPQAVEPGLRLPPNVSRHPACAPAEAVAWMRRFSAGLIPFARTPLTAGVDPVKFYMYRGAGLPVLSTRFGTMAERGEDDGVWFLDSPDGSIDRDALRASVNAATSARAPSSAIAEFRRQFDWHERLRPALQSLGL